MFQTNAPRRYRSLFLSDIHLGSRGCRAASLVAFLRDHDADAIYLVGDIVDGWRLRKAWHWPQLHNDVVQKLLRKARKGSRVVYIPGNHDEFLRDYLGTHFGGVEVVNRAIHVTAQGVRLLVTHGDEFDAILSIAPWFSKVGDGAYAFALAVNKVFNAIRRPLGLTYFSLSAWAKSRVKNAVNFIGDYERVLAAEARHAGVDGVICGHIHHATMHRDFGLLYVNTGDWVESCTAVVEHFDGTLELIRWTGMGVSAGKEDEFSEALEAPVAA